MIKTYFRIECDGCGEKRESHRDDYSSLGYWMGELAREHGWHPQSSQGDFCSRKCWAAARKKAGMKGD